MGMIYCFSMEDAEHSDQTSGQLSEAVIRIAYPDFEKKTPDEQQRIFDDVQHIVRKTAHFMEYMLLGFLMRLCMESWFGRKKGMTPASWGAATLYACTDEMHQLRIDGRSGQWTDVAIDSFGVFAGTMIAELIIYFALKKHTKA